MRFKLLNFKSTGTNSTVEQNAMTEPIAANKPRLATGLISEVAKVNRPAAVVNVVNNTATPVCSSA